ncbi:translocation/assembly module TamB domain-containing protein [Flavisolibacter tropicus]|uniref:translocation/assembly module TamB domain-containing protein n=1 Tax=Flavisolibacter tropicus TaxID=1492898 RepID=UPI001313E9C6|nr:translocation/assembly module TamB [Flavisolibacter tropicus]
MQRFATHKVELYLQNKLKTKVEIGSIHVGLPRMVHLQNVYIEDRTKDTLLSGGSIKVNIDLFQLLSNKVEIKDVQLTDITAKVKRILPDTVFNFQFVVDAFAPKSQTTADTSQTAAIEFNVDHLGLDNVKVVYKDVITGNDMYAAINNLSLNIDTLNPYTSHYILPSMTAKGIKVRFNQATPLVTPDPLSKDIAEAAEPITMKLSLGNVVLDDLDLQYGNDVSAFYTLFNIGHLVLDGRQLDLQNQVLHLDKLQLDNAVSAIRLGKKPEARLVAKQVKQEVVAQKQQNWRIRVDDMALNKNTVQFDNDNNPKQPHGIDYAHFRGDSLTLHIKDFVMNGDSVAAVITQGFFKEKSGFQLDAMQGELLYANNQSYLKNLYLKTPGTELKRNAVLEYESFDALTKKPAETVIDLELVDSRIQVKDILAFAPQLRGHPALRDPNAVWYVNIVGNGTLNRLNFESLRFRGLKNTELDASGTLAGLMNPTDASGTFTIRRFHTSQTDLSVFTGQRLSTRDINLPETFAASGTLSGNMSNLGANLTIQTAMGNIGVSGRFANLTNPTKASYNAVVRTQSLRIGSIMRNNTIGALTANMRVVGSGTTPDNMNVRFNGVVNSFGYNNYTYRNVKLDGNFRQSLLNVTTDIHDPNIDLSGTARVNLKNSAISFNGFVDSIKTQPLGFTTEPLVFRGRVDANVSSMSADYLDANVSITDGLLVSGKDRLTLDSLQLVAGRNGTNQFIRLSSPIASATIEGQYRYAELGAIIQNNIDPYFSIVPGNKLQKVSPYDFTFQLDLVNSPFLSAFVPGLEIRDSIHVRGSMATGRGMQAVASAASLVYNGMDITGLKANINTTADGLQLTGTLAHLQTGTTDIYNTRLNATALDNVINFGLKVADIAGKDKYVLAGVLHQPRQGIYAMQLHSDSLLLNYDRWNIAENNEILISSDIITANNFSLQRGGQSLSIQSEEGMSGGPLNVKFGNFKMGTITGFMKADTLLVDGTINGTITFVDIMQQPLFTSNLRVDNLSFRGDTLGNLQLNVNNNRVNSYVADVSLTGFGNNVRVTGSMLQQENDVVMDLNMSVQPLQLNSLEGVLADFVKQASGAVNGNISISGTASAPKVQGNLNFDKASISTYMLGGPLKIDGEAIAVTENGFAFNNFTIKDSVNNALTINGTASTTNFINYGLNLDINADNFKVLNTTRKDNKLFFGDMVITTKMHVGGTEIKPVVSGNVTVKKGTDFTIVIPQEEPGVVQREGVVEFVDFSAPENDSLFLAYDSLNKTNVLGMDVSANISIEREANFNVIVDVANGDLLNMKGTGQLSTGIDPSGNITLTGTYEIEEGGYQFSFNFLRRKFILQKGSKITWYGEPTNAQLDATAIYVANTAPLDLVSNQISDPNQRNYYLQKLPFNVLLKLQGELMKPELTFDIILPEEQNYTVSGDVLSTVNTRLTQLRQEPSELNRQVFSILLLNRFVGDNPFESSSGGFSAETIARQSVSKLLTEQLNDLAGGLINGVDINFDVQSSDDYTTGQRRSRTDLNVGLSKRLLNDRLTVTVGSDFMLEGATQSNQNADNIAGNVAVNYQLSRDNRYMLRFYRKNEYDAVVDGYIIETGVGFIMTVDYNRFRQIFLNRRPKNQNRQATPPKTEGGK